MIRTPEAPVKIAPAMLGANIRAARTSREIQVSDVARTIGVMPALYARWEAGNADISPGHFAAIAAMLDYSTEDLSRPTFAGEIQAVKSADARSAIAGRIRSIRKSLGWTQDELAKHSGVSRANLAAYETGTLPPPDKLQMIANAVRLSLGFFYDGRMVAPDRDNDDMMFANLISIWEGLNATQRRSVLLFARAISAPEDGGE